MIPLTLLKVPAVYVLNELFRISFAFPEIENAFWAEHFNKNSTFNNVDHGYCPYTNSTIGQTENNKFTQQHYIGVVLAILKMVICWLIFMSMIFIIFLSAKYTYIIYLHIISIIVVIVSGWENIQTLNMLSVKYEQFEMDQIHESIIWERDGIVNNLMMQRIGDILYMILLNFLIQLSLWVAFEYFQSYTKNYLNHRMYGFYFAIPTILTFIPNTCNILTTTSVLLTLYPLCKMLFLNIYFTLVEIVNHGYRNVAIHLTENFGMHLIILKEWKRIKIPLIFQIFWIMRVIEPFLCLSANGKLANITTYDAMKYLITEGCDTFISLSGMISYISCFCCYLETFVQRVLLNNTEGDGHMKLVSTIFFYLLALITELTGLEPDERLTQFFQNVYIIWIILLHFIHKSCYLILVCVFVSNNKRSIRAVMVCGFVILFAVTMLTYLWFYHSFSRFLLLASTLNIQIILKVLVSLVIYTLFVIDAHSLTSWLNLDDYVFYIKTFQSMIDVGLNIFILLVSAYMKWPGNFPNMILSSVLYCFFLDKIRDKVKKKWRLFVIRQSVVRKIESMLDATSEQLTEYNSFCVICYENLNTAKVTNCNHYFHGQCLRKWLYINNFCPMCLKKPFF